MPIAIVDPVYTDAPTLAEQLTDAPLKNWDAHFQEADGGHLLESVPAFLTQYNMTLGPTAIAQFLTGGQNPSTSGPYVQNTGICPQQLSTLATIVMPPEAKASYILRAQARVGTGTVPTAGELAVEAYGATPTTGQIAVAPNGDIVLLGSDAWTDLDVLVVCLRSKYVVLTLPVIAATGVCALPAGLGVQYLQSATVLAGTTLGAKIVLVPATAAPATGKAQLDLAKANVRFATADAVTQAQIVLSVASALKSFEALSSIGTTP
jgi:hypothetical protein